MPRDKKQKEEEVRFEDRRLDGRRRGGNRRIKIAQAHCDQVRTDFLRRARLPTAAEILDVERTVDSQAGVSTQAAQDSVNALVERKHPLVWEIEGSEARS